MTTTIEKVTGVQTMDSREIAELTGKLHAHVCRDIQTMLDDLGIDRSSFGSVYRAGNGEDRRCFRLPRRECLILVSGYSVELRARIIDRWEELERKSQNFMPTSFSEALQLAANQARELERARPLVAVAEKIAVAENTMTLKDFAKSVGEGPVKIFGKLARLGILFRNSQMDWVPKQELIERGYFRTVVNPIPHRDRTINHTTTLVTGKGEVWLASKLSEASA